VPARSRRSVTSSVTTPANPKGGPARCVTTERGLDRPPAQDRRSTVNDNLFTEPGPRDRLLEALDPQGDIDLGLAVVIAQDLTDDTATVLTELIQKRIARVPARRGPGPRRAQRSGLRCAAPADPSPTARRRRAARSAARRRDPARRGHQQPARRSGRARQRRRLRPRLPGSGRRALEPVWPGPAVTSLHDPREPTRPRGSACLQCLLVRGDVATGRDQ